MLIFLILFFSFTFSINLNFLEQKNCTERIHYYTNLINRLDKLISFSSGLRKERLITLKNNINKRLQRSQNVCNNNIDPILINVLNLNYIKEEPVLSYEEYVSLPIGEKVLNISGFYFKFDLGWYLIDKYSYWKVGNNFNYYYNFIKNKYNDKIVFYHEDKIYVTNKENILYLGKLDPTKDIFYNLNILENYKNFYITGILASNYSEGILRYALVRKNNDLFFVNFVKGNYYTLDIDNFMKPDYFGFFSRMFFSGNVYYYITGGKIYISKDFKKWYLGDIRMYTIMNFQKLADTLRSTFEILSLTNRNFNYKNYIDILIFSQNFSGKRLSDLYKFFIDNMSYSSEIKNLTKMFNQKEIENLVFSDYKYGKYWDIFYVFKEKVGVCESFSNLLNLVALFNGMDIDVLYGYLKSDQNFLHQVSRINNYYYDVTLDIENKSFNYFGMDENRLDLYFIRK